MWTRVRTTCSKVAPACASARSMIARHSFVCSYEPSGGGEPSARNWRRAGDEHAVAHDDCSAVAHDRLVGRRAGDVAPLHQGASIAARAGASPDRRVARRVRRSRSRRSRRPRPHARRRGSARAARLRLEARDGARVPRGRGGRRDRPRRGCRPARDDGASPARTYVGASVRRSARQSRNPARRRIYSNEAFRVLADHVAARAEMPFADYVLAAVCVPLEIGLDPTGDPGSGMHAIARGCPRDRSRARVAEAGRTRDPRRDGGRPVSGPRGRPSRLRTLRSPRLGPRRATEHLAALVDGDADVRASVRALRGHGHLPLGRSGRRGRLCRARRPASSATGRKRPGRASPTRFSPRATS